MVGFTQNADFPWLYVNLPGGIVHLPTQTGVFHPGASALRQRCAAAHHGVLGRLAMLTHMSRVQNLCGLMLMTSILLNPTNSY